MVGSARRCITLWLGSYVLSQGATCSLFLWRLGGRNLHEDARPLGEILLARHRAMQAESVRAQTCLMSSTVHRAASPRPDRRLSCERSRDRWRPTKKLYSVSAGRLQRRGGVRVRGFGTSQTFGKSRRKKKGKPTVSQLLHAVSPRGSSDPTSRHKGPDGRSHFSTDCGRSRGTHRPVTAAVSSVPSHAQPSVSSLASVSSGFSGNKYRISFKEHHVQKHRWDLTESALFMADARRCSIWMPHLVMHKIFRVEGGHRVLQANLSVEGQGHACACCPRVWTLLPGSGVHCTCSWACVCESLKEILYQRGCLSCPIKVLERTLGAARPYHGTYFAIGAFGGRGLCIGGPGPCIGGASQSGSEDLSAGSEVLCSHRPVTNAGGRD